MGRGRAPCCEKVGLKKGPWTPAEDMRLMAYIHKHGHGNWRALPKQAGLLRCGKSCRLRWINYLRPDVKRGNFTPEEEETIIKLHELLGNKWSKIASRLPGRTDNEIKNVWNTHLKKRLVAKESNSPKTNKPKDQSSSISFSSNSPASCCNQGEGMGLEEQAQTVIDSKISDAVHIKNNQDQVMEEAIELPIESSIWEMLEEDGLSMQETSADGAQRDICDTELKKRLLLEGPNLSLDEPKQSSSSSSSSCSSDSCVSYTNRVDRKGLEEQAQPPLKSGRLDDADGIENGEIMKQDPFMETPKTSIDLTLDFWGVLDDDFMGFLPTATVGPIEDHQEGHQHIISEEDRSKEGDSKMWISYLENELGLWAPNSNDHQSQSNSTVDDQSPEPCPTYNEIDPVIAYFQMHPSSSPIFSM